MNQVHVNVDEEDAKPDNLVPLVSGNIPIITVPASDDENEAEDVVEDSEDEDIQEALGEVDRLDREVQELRKEIMNILSSIPVDVKSHQHTVVPQIDVWDTGKAWEQEYRLYPDSNRKEVSDRLSNQIWDLFQIMQERINQQTWNNKDIELINVLKAISVMHFRLGNLTEKVLKRKAKKPCK